MEEHRCPLCGNRFKKSAATACKGCFLSGGCDKIKCTNCGYEFIPGVDER